jgi:hypothetical protein
MSAVEAVLSQIDSLAQEEQQLETAEALLGDVQQRCAGDPDDEQLAAYCTERLTWLPEKVNALIRERRHDAALELLMRARELAARGDDPQVLAAAIRSEAELALALGSRRL